MARFLSHIIPLLMLGYAYADEAKDAPMPETMNMTGIIIFLVLSIGSCVGFFWYMWYKEMKRKQHEKEQKT